MENKFLKLYRIVTIFCSIIILLFLILAAMETQLNQEWYHLQQRYKDILMQKAANKDELESNQKYTPKIRQIVLNDLSIIDRCNSCHVGFDNPGMDESVLPFMAHSGDYLKSHPAEKYGCTICHGGQGRALTKVEAHAQAEGIYWEYPLLPLKGISSYCGKCHLSIFESSPQLKNIPNIKSGLKIFRREGCMGCHKARSVGGMLGPDLTNQGAKSKNQYHYDHILGKRSVHNWLKEHFVDPDRISPGSEMIKFDLPEEEIDYLITFLLGLFKPMFPLEYYSLNTIREFKSQRSEVTNIEGFAIFCSACHGKNGEGIEYKKDTIGIPTLSNPDFQAVASFEFIEFTVREGRSQRQMGSWKPRRSRLLNKELIRIINFIRHWRKKAPTFSKIQDASGNLKYGNILFREQCSTCHGPTGKGDFAPAINNQDFLSIASDKFLYQTLVVGRSNTAMPSWSRLSADDLASLISVIRSWQNTPKKIIDDDIVSGNVDHGRELFHYLCTRCHGKFGQGGTGTAILNKDFLRAAPDQFIIKSISRGRTHTAMLGWTKDLSSKERLKIQDIENIVSFMKSNLTQQFDFIFSRESLGNPVRGKKLYNNLCVECHGKNGDDLQAPALHNQEFLNAASNGYLLATITLGRNGTAMPSWGKGSEKYRKLTSEERVDLVAYVRKWQRLTIKRLASDDIN
jgi:cbb3-type cytochrome c oxidase subunit III